MTRLCTDVPMLILWTGLERVKSQPIKVRALIPKTASSRLRTESELKSGLHMDPNNGGLEEAGQTGDVKPANIAEIVTFGESWHCFPFVSSKLKAM